MPTSGRVTSASAGQDRDADDELTEAPLADEPQHGDRAVRLERRRQDQTGAKPGRGREQGERRDRHVADVEALEERRPDEGGKRPAGRQPDQAQPPDRDQRGPRQPADFDERPGQGRQGGHERQGRRRVEERVGRLVDRRLGDDGRQVDRDPGREVLAGPEVDPEIAQELAAELDEIGQQGGDRRERGERGDRLPATPEPAHAHDGQRAQDDPHRPERRPVPVR